MMTQEKKSTSTDRRHFLQWAAASAATSLGLSVAHIQQAWAAVDEQKTTTSQTLPVDCVRALVDTIFPKTDTPSATEAGVHEFLIFMYNEWMEPVDKVNFDAGFKELQAVSNNRYGANFERLDGKIQHLLLTQFELEALRQRNFFAKPILREGEKPLIGKTFFYRLKDLVIVGYFTSKVGIEATLHFNPIPGGFDGDQAYDTKDKGPYRYYIDEKILQGV